MPAPPAASQVRSFRLEAPLSRVMPLFTAEGERSWAPGWEPVILSGDVERGRASYARLAQGSNIGLVDVVCTEAEGGGTVVTVRYTLTGVSEQGRAFVREFLDPQHYAAMIDEWRVATSAALARQPTAVQ